MTPPGLLARLAASSHWLASFFAAQTFLPMQAALGSWCLLLNSALLLAAMLLAILALPETRGKSRDAIRRDLGA